MPGPDPAAARADAPEPADVIDPREQRRRAAAWARDALRRGVATGWGANLTGSAGMVSYSAVLALVPIALLALFAASILLRSAAVEQAVIDAVQSTLPAPVRSGVLQGLDGVRASGAGLGLGALASGMWIGVSFWSALDNAFRRIYAFPERSWVEQKRFGLRMLLLGLLLVVPALALPAVRAGARTGLEALPFDSTALRVLLSTSASWFLLGFVLCAIYRLVPNGRVPWRGVWPGALLSGAIILLAANVFPLYLGASTVLEDAGAAVGFLLVLLVWVYVMAIALLLGAVLNATVARVGRAPAPGPEVLVAAGVARPIEPAEADAPTAVAPPPQALDVEPAAPSGGAPATRRDDGNDEDAPPRAAPPPGRRLRVVGGAAEAEAPPPARDAP